MSKAAFYRSAAWRRLSRAFLLSRNYICERCGQPAEIAHHRRYLTPQNVNNPDISLNPDNLEALCSGNLEKIRNLSGAQEKQKQEKRVD